VLPATAKLARVREVAWVVRQHGMTFGAADNEFQYLSDTSCCCSGVDQFPGFGNWFKHQIGYALRRARGRSEIKYSLISSEWCPSGSVDRYLNSRSRLGSRNGLTGSVRAHIRARWDGLGRPGNPASFYGVVPVAGLAGGRARIYRWADDARELQRSLRPSR